MQPKRVRRIAIRRWPPAVVTPLAGALVLGVVAALYLFVFPIEVPPASRLADSTKILDRQGRVLYEVPVPDQGNHTDLALSQISPALRQATVATEDASFYHNPGFDILALGRALVQNLAGGAVVSGGSTITQQLARGLYFTPEERASQSLVRKLGETVLAFRLNARLSKDQVLDLYLNRAYYGRLAYGVEAAARTYFGKSARDLDLTEAALLSGLPQSPARYDPLSHWEAAKQRQAVVLSRLRDEGYVSEEQAEAALQEPLRLAEVPFPIHAPHFVAYVRQWMEKNLPPEALDHGGLKVYTTLDLDLQITAEDLARRNLARLRDHNASDVALVATEVASGEILAMVGSADYFDASIDGEVNMALAPRQPGSALKPITYAVALGQGYTAATPLLDVPTNFLTRLKQPYSPNNYDATFHGPVSVRYALASSFNVPAVRVMNEVGVDSVLRLAWDLGITTLSDANRYDLSLTLGGGEVSLLELTSVYASFASGGLRRDPSVVTRVEDSAGQTLYRRQPSPALQVVSPQVAYLITDVLSDNHARAPAFGENSPLRLSRPAAAKTGTTGDFRDNWTVGYTPDLAVGVWVGNADNRSMRDVSGISGAAPLWHDFMEEALKTTPARGFSRPPGLVREEICEPTGLKPGPWCPERRLELFIAGTEPASIETYYRPAPACLPSGQSGPEGCPPGSTVEKVFTFVPEEAMAWASAAGLPLPQRAAYQAAPPGGDPVSLWVRLVSPGPGEVLALSREIPLESQQLVLEALAGGPTPVAQVELYDNGSLVETLRQAPYRTWWGLTPGEHSFRAVAYDGQGHRSESAPASVTVLP